MDLQEIMPTVKDELNLYLVANRLKPAMEMSFPFLWLGFEDYNLKLDIFRTILGNLPVVYDVSRKKIPYLFGNYEQTYFNIGADREKLERLLQAKNYRELGIAYGFPLEAVEAYEKGVRAGSGLIYPLESAKEAGIKLPSWIAYISHVPEQLDLMGGRVSPSSKALGEKYQEYVQKNNSELAERVERYFQENYPGAG